MDTFKSAGSVKNLYIKNLDRIDERIIYTNILSRLKKRADVVLASEVLLPYTDRTSGTFKSIPFYIIFDLDYGTYIHCDNQNCLNEIELILQNN